VADLIYIVNVSLDGLYEDEHGDFQWTAPSDDRFACITELLRPVGTYLYGRRTYEAMALWETDPTLAEASELRADFARVWQAADKVVYSTTLTEVPTARTRLERRFDADAVRARKAAADRDLTVGGPELAAHALRAGLVDELHLFVLPLVVGRGKRALPDDGRVDLALLDERRFDDGSAYLRYRVTG